MFSHGLLPVEGGPGHQDLGPCSRFTTAPVVLGDEVGERVAQIAMDCHLVAPNVVLRIPVDVVQRQVVAVTASLFAQLATGLSDALDGGADRPLGVVPGLHQNRYLSSEATASSHRTQKATVSGMLGRFI